MANRATFVTESGRYTEQTYYGLGSYVVRPTKRKSSRITSLFGQILICEEAAGRGTGGIYWPKREGSCPPAISFDRSGVRFPGVMKVRPGCPRATGDFVEVALFCSLARFLPS